MENNLEEVLLEEGIEEEPTQRGADFGIPADDEELEELEEEE